VLPRGVLRSFWLASHWAAPHCLQVPQEVTLQGQGKVLAFSAERLLRDRVQVGGWKAPRPCKVLLYVATSRQPQQSLGALQCCIGSNGKFRLGHGAWDEQTLAGLLGVDAKALGSARCELRLAQAESAAQQLRLPHPINCSRGAAAAAASGRSTASSGGGGGEDGSGEDGSGEDGAASAPQQLMFGHMLVLLDGACPDTCASQLCSSEGGSAWAMTFKLPRMQQVRPAPPPEVRPVEREAAPVTLRQPDRLPLTVTHPCLPPPLPAFTGPGPHHHDPGRAMQGVWLPLQRPGAGPAGA
jgi:hypothetical protein